MDKIEKLKSQNDNFFDFRVEEKDSISVLAAGYIITPEGKFVNVLDSEAHSNVFSNYLRAYTEDIYRPEEDTFHAIRSLTKLNHIAYMGIKLGDPVFNSGDNQGYALLVLPDDLSSLTNEQRHACLMLFECNKSIFSSSKKVELEIHDFANKEYSEEELISRFREEVSVGNKQI